VLISLMREFKKYLMDLQLSKRGLSIWNDYS